ncbi:MAG: NADPH-dependent F420 reductase [Acetobacteraceae bacterium]
MHIGIIGTGLVAITLAEHWTAAGHAVALGSRDPGAATVKYPVAGVADVVRGNQVLVNATPGAVSLEALGAIGPGAYDGKVVIDVANAVTPSFELMYPNSSLGERLAGALPGAKIVKTLNTAAMTVLTRPSSMEPASVFVSGDDEAAKATATGLLHDLGWSGDDIIDLGGIQTARATEHYFLLFAALMRATGRPFNIRVVTG